MEPVIDFSKNRVIEEIAPAKKNRYTKILIIFLLLGFFTLSILYFLTFVPNPNFNGSVIVKIGQGESVQTISKKLKENNIIISDTVFSVTVKSLRLRD